MILRKKEYTLEKFISLSLIERENAVNYVIKHYDNVGKCNFLIKCGNLLDPSSINQILMSICIKGNKKTKEENKEELNTFLNLLGKSYIFAKEQTELNSHIIMEANKLIRKNGYEISCQYLDFLEQNNLDVYAINNCIDIILSSENACRRALTMNKFANNFNEFLGKINDYNEIYIILKEGKLSSEEQLRKVLLKLKTNPISLNIADLINCCDSEDEGYYRILVNLIIELKIPIKPSSYYYVNMSKLGKDTRINIIKMITVYEYQKLIIFIENNSLHTDEIMLLYKKAVDNKDKKTMVLFPNFVSIDKISDVSNIVFEDLLALEPVTTIDIIGIKISNLNPSNRGKYIQILIDNNYDINKLIYLVIKNKELLNSDTINNVTQYVATLKDPVPIYSYAYGMKDRISNMSVLTESVSKLGNVSFMYEFLTNICVSHNEDGKILKDSILHSNDKKYIFMLAVYVDQSLIKKIFESKTKMFKLMASSKLFTAEELGNVALILFDKKIKELPDEEPNSDDGINQTQKTKKSYIEGFVQMFEKTLKEEFDEKRIADLNAVLEAELDRIDKLRDEISNGETGLAKKYINTIVGQIKDKIL